MAIKITIVEEDLITAIPEFEYSIDTESLNQLQDSAQKMNLAFTSAIEKSGYTIINELQQDPFEQEIKLLRQNSKANPVLLDTLQQAINFARQGGCRYIKFTGNQ